MDTYSLPNYLPATPAMYGVKQESLQYNQGTDIVIPAALLDNGYPVNANDYTLRVRVKDNTDDMLLIWSGEINYGIYVTANGVTIRIPRDITLKMFAGIYYVAIEGVSKRNPNHSSILFQTTISVNQTAFSSLPVFGAPDNYSEDMMNKQYCSCGTKINIMTTTQLPSLNLYPGFSLPDGSMFVTDDYGFFVADKRYLVKSLSLFLGNAAASTSHLEIYTMRADLENVGQYIYGPNLFTIDLTVNPGVTQTYSLSSNQYIEAGNVLAWYINGDTTNIRSLTGTITVEQYPGQFIVNNSSVTAECCSSCGLPANLGAIVPIQYNY